MKARIYTSNKKTLFLALEDIYLQFQEDFFINDFDFIILAISPEFDPKDINPTIQKILNTKNYLAFNAVDAFSHDKLSNSLAALFIKFEKDGKINIKDDINNLDKSKLNVIFVPYQNELDCVCDVIAPINFPLIGGVCSGDNAFIYYEDRIEKKYPVILEFENIEYEFGISLGYKPIGPTYKVQVASKNKLYVVDYEDASLLTKRLLANTDGNITNLWYSPLLIVSDKEGIVDVVRTFKGIKENYYVEFYGKIDRDSNVKLSFATNKMLLQEDKKTAMKLKEKISPELIFNFSCVAREFILDDKKMKENEIYSQILNAPLFGFFTYGEVGPDYKFTTSKLYNQSSLVVAIKEK